MAIAELTKEVEALREKLNNIEFSPDGVFDDDIGPKTVKASIDSLVERGLVDQWSYSYNTPVVMVGKEPTVCGQSVELDFDGTKYFIQLNCSGTHSA